MHVSSCGKADHLEYLNIAAREKNLIKQLAQYEKRSKTIYIDLERDESVRHIEKILGGTFSTWKKRIEQKNLPDWKALFRRHVEMNIVQWSKSTKIERIENVLRIVIKWWTKERSSISFFQRKKFQREREVILQTVTLEQDWQEAHWLVQINAKNMEKLQKSFKNCAKIVRQKSNLERSRRKCVCTSVYHFKSHVFSRNSPCPLVVWGTCRLPHFVLDSTTFLRLHLLSSLQCIPKIAMYYWDDH